MSSEQFDFTPGQLTQLKNLLGSAWLNPSKNEVDVSWTPPAQTSNSPTGYALLCADSDGNPEDIFTTPLPYSQCVNGKINRRALPGVNGQTIAVDGGESLGTAAAEEIEESVGLTGLGA